MQEKKILKRPLKMREFVYDLYFGSEGYDRLDGKTTCEGCDRRYYTLKLKDGFCKRCIKYFNKRRVKKV